MGTLDGESHPNLERLLTEAPILLSGESNAELPALLSLKVTGEGLDSTLGLGELTDVGLASSLAGGVGR